MTQNANQILLEAYLAHLLHQRQLSPLTITSYRSDLEQLQALLPGTAWQNMEHFTIRKISAQLHAKGLSPRSLARKLSAWRSFFNWLAEQDATTLESNPIQGVKGPKRNKPLPKSLGVDDAVRLVSSGPVAQLDALELATLACNRAMFELLYSSGLRVSELCLLDYRYHGAPINSLGWIDLAEREVTVTGKGNKMRRVPIGQAATDALQDWLAQRPLLAAPEQAALFLNERARRISPRVVQLRLKAHAQQQAMPTHVHPHMLRHSFASHVLQSSGDLRAVQEMLGHTSIAATQVYTALDFQHLSHVYDAAHPRAKRK
jgi:integrase/recombinase XerC